MLRLTEVLGEIQTDDHPSVTIHGDGRVVVHRTTHQLEPGDHETKLDEAEVQELLVSIVESGLLDFDAAEAAARRRAVDARTGLLRHVSDPSTLTLELHLARVVDADGIDRGAITRRISWQGLRAHAQWYPDIEPLQAFSAAHSKITDLARRAVAAGR